MAERINKESPQPMPFKVEISNNKISDAEYRMLLEKE